MFVEFTDSDGRLVLVNTEKVITVADQTETLHAFLVLEGDVKVNVKESFEEIRNRLGPLITNRTRYAGKF
jgi:hypothetical protein